MNNSSDDYDPAQLIRELSANIKQPDKFAEIFCSAAKTQKPIDTTIKGIVFDLLNNNAQFRLELSLMISHCLKEDWKMTFKKLWIPAWSIIMVAIGVLLQKHLF